jgi:hypothetical protein
MSLTNEGLVQQIRDLVLRMARTPTRPLEPVEEQSDQTRESVRQLARSRVSLLLRQLRAAQGLTYAAIQEQTGFPQQMLYDVEYKDRRLSLDELRTLAQCYNITINDILGVDIDSEQDTGYGKWNAEYKRPDVDF